MRYLIFATSSILERNGFCRIRVPLTVDRQGRHQFMNLKTEGRGHHFEPWTVPEWMSSGKGKDAVALSGERRIGRL